ncbi:hypothetical protein C5Y96_05220 [Blastopirellula marina]|uniref:Uncharacterized protein n=1 Tax=Blastopirellula marina TaxID=124 RepID=A0A2S8G477_9BACT|nr:MULTISPECIES: hypothetical protein [Pirellulaceae]PQO39259.1 hypothetical protein C5Y96_05220 [Blastopirellula marina]RCS55567.1 hypothetical protein DTL36_05230 [Bremerella cremea]
MSLEPGDIIVLVIAAFALVVGICLRLLSGKLDRRRVEYFVNGRGDKLLSIQWAPFGPWALGERSGVYQIRYLDKEGCEHQAYVKTSLINGVWFSEDRIIRRPSPGTLPGNTPNPESQAQ